MNSLTEIYDFDALYEVRLREENQDSHLELTIGETLLLVVCDGMGGVRGGSRASRLAVEAIRDTVKDLHGGLLAPGEILRRAIGAGNDAIQVEIRKEPLLAGMGTTAVVAWLHGTQVHVAWVGDSRAGIAQKGALRWVTHDHTRVQELVREGQISAEEAEHHPYSHILSRAVGVEPYLEVDVLEPFELEPGAVLILCSDGVHGAAEDDELAELMSSFGPSDIPPVLAQRLGARGSDDNATAIFCALQGTTAPSQGLVKPPPPGPPAPAPRPASATPPPESGGSKLPLTLGIVAFVAVSALLGWIFLTRTDEPPLPPAPKAVPDLEQSPDADALGAMIREDRCVEAAKRISELERDTLAALTPGVFDCLAKVSPLEGEDQSSAIAFYRWVAGKAPVPHRSALNAHPTLGANAVAFSRDLLDAIEDLPPEGRDPLCDAYGELYWTDFDAFWARAVRDQARQAENDERFDGLCNPKPRVEASRPKPEPAVAAPTVEPPAVQPELKPGDTPPVEGEKEGKIPHWGGDQKPPTRQIQVELSLPADFKDEATLTTTCRRPGGALEEVDKQSSAGKSVSLAVEDAEGCRLRVSVPAARAQSVKLDGVTTCTVKVGPNDAAKAGPASDDAYTIEKPECK